VLEKLQQTKSIAQADPDRLRESRPKILSNLGGKDSRHPPVQTNDLPSHPSAVFSQ
jgi:hypothetical protein